MRILQEQMLTHTAYMFLFIFKCIAMPRHNIDGMEIIISNKVSSYIDNEGLSLNEHIF